ncbi:MAG: hypothetical protein QWI36_04575 [Wolbachia endosymbiont of Tyrophagus putrescentiae]|nr:hypothetical protein [Wolbachia endosymbiont of Tyrophagus putrescentiae]
MKDIYYYRRKLETLWSHYITGKLERLHVRNDYAKYYDPNFNIYGFKVAYHDCESEAVAFFYKR